MAIFSVTEGPVWARELASRAEADRLHWILRLANPLNAPGEELPKVNHYYTDPHPYYDLDVLVIGGKNSAAIAALDLWRHGARVTLVHRGPAMHRHVKYWILPDIQNRIKNGEVTAYFDSTVARIDLDTVTLATPEARWPFRTICLCDDRVSSGFRFSGLVAAH